MPGASPGPEFTATGRNRGGDHLNGGPQGCPAYPGGRRDVPEGRKMTQSPSEGRQRLFPKNV